MTELRQHQRLHDGEGLHCCNVCGKMFEVASRLNAHLKRHEQRNEIQVDISTKGDTSVSSGPNGQKLSETILSAQQPVENTSEKVLSVEN